MLQGQYIRLFVGAHPSSSLQYPILPIAAATNLTFHISASTENVTTKDLYEGEFWDVFNVTGLAWDVSTDALVLADDDDANNLNNLSEWATTYSDHEFTIDISISGDEYNREQEWVLAEGFALPTQLSVNAVNRQNSTLTASFTGNGALTVGSD